MPHTHSCRRQHNLLRQPLCHLPCRTFPPANHPLIMPLEPLPGTPHRTSPLGLYTCRLECPFSLLNLCRALLHLHNPSRLLPYVASNVERSGTCSLTAPTTSAHIAESMPLDTTRKNAWSVRSTCKTLELLTPTDVLKKLLSELPHLATKLTMTMMSTPTRTWMENVKVL